MAETIRSGIEDISSAEPSSGDRYRGIRKGSNSSKNERQIHAYSHDNLRDDLENDEHGQDIGSDQDIDDLKRDN